ncbi:hypothetical protein A9Q96_08300 [Rhodobacterales bacterium 52_120_T64]|nr:hypothetical protein A9Q96_08300 [Rhodobacterales bacterium 52_120_T64]
MSEILVKLEVAQGRRLFGVLAIVGLGLTLLYIAAVFPPTKILSLLSLIAVGGLFIWAGTRLYRSTFDTVLLTREAITTQSGRVLCRLDDIATVDRGFFAFKPSNGFLILLKKRGGRSWAPGIWWQLGKHLGIGGVTSPRQSKEMVSIIQILLAEKKAAQTNSE